MMDLFSRLSSFISKPKAKWVGIDISDSVIKLLELSKHKETYQVESFTIAPLPANVVMDNNIKDIDAVGATILKAKKQSNTKATEAIIALPGSFVISKIIQLGIDLCEDEIEAEVLIEAKRLVPYAPDEVSLDFYVLGPSTVAEGFSDVLIVAARKEYVSMRASAAEIGEFKTIIVDIEPYAIARATSLIADQLPNDGINKVIAIVDIGATTTTLTVMQNFNAIYSREEIFGGKQLTLDIQKKYSLSFSEAGLAKKQGNLPQDYETEVLDTFRQAIITHVRRTLQFFFAANRIVHIDCLLLAGGVVLTPGLTELLEKQIDIPTIVANPFENMIISPKVDSESLKNNSSALMLCVGLALRGFAE